MYSQQMKIDDNELLGIRKPRPVELKQTSNSTVVSLSEKIANSAGMLVQQSANGKGASLAPQSRAASVIAEILSDTYAYDASATIWHRFCTTHWKEDEDKAIQATITDILYKATDPLGFSANYQSGIFRLLASSNLMSFPPRRGERENIPFTNGQLNIRTMEFAPTTPQNAQRWCLPHRYDQDADCPVFRDWLLDKLNKDQDSVDLIRAFIAAVLRGGAYLHKFLHLVGPAGSGKSTLGRVLFEIVGEENRTTTDMKNLETTRFETAGLYGKRLVCIEDAHRYGGNLSVFKAMTGQDPLRLERKNVQQRGSFIFDGMVLVMSNEFLTSSDYSSGIERRRVTVVFDNVSSDDDRLAWNARGGEEAILHPEIPGIINWALGLSSQQIRQAFADMPDRVKQANVEAARFNNPVADWMLENCVPDGDAKTKVGVKQESIEQGKKTYENSKTQLYPNYLAWSLGANREPVSMQRFSNTAIDVAKKFGAAVTKNRENTGVHIHGLRLRDFGERTWSEDLSAESEHRNEG